MPIKFVDNTKTFFTNNSGRVKITAALTITAVFAVSASVLYTNIFSPPVPAVPEAQAAVTVASATTSYISGSGIQSTTFSLACTGTDRLILVAVSYYHLSSIAFVSYAGQSLTLLGSTTTSGGYPKIGIYYRINPTSGTNNVVVIGTFDRSWGPEADVGVICFNGVNQTTPLGALAINTGLSSGTTASLDVTSAAGDLVFSALSHRNNTTAASPNGGETQQFNTGGTLSYDMWIAGSTEIAGGASTNMSWAVPYNGTIYAIAGVAVKPAPAVSPTVTTSAASSITSSSATLNGAANPNGFSTTGWFRYSATNPGSCNDTFGTRAPLAGGATLGSGTSAVSYSEPLSGLSSGTIYYFCAIANNSGGTGLGSVLSFTTSAATPTVATNAATNITASSAILNGSANPNGNAATGWFRYGTTNPGSCDDAFGTRAPLTGGTALGSGTAAVSYPENISGLSPSTVYYFCAIAENSGGKGYGSVLSLTTLASAPPAFGVILNQSTNEFEGYAWSETIGWISFNCLNTGTCGTINYKVQVAP